MKLQINRRSENISMKCSEYDVYLKDFIPSFLPYLNRLASTFGSCI